MTYRQLTDRLAANAVTSAVDSARHAVAVGYATDTEKTAYIRFICDSIEYVRGCAYRELTDGLASRNLDVLRDYAKGGYMTISEWKRHQSLNRAIA